METSNDTGTLHQAEALVTAPPRSPEHLHSHRVISGLSPTIPSEVVGPKPDQSPRQSGLLLLAQAIEVSSGSPTRPHAVRHTSIVGGPIPNAYTSGVCPSDIDLSEETISHHSNLSKRSSPFASSGHSVDSRSRSETDFEPDQNPAIVKAKEQIKVELNSLRNILPQADLDFDLRLTKESPATQPRLGSPFPAEDGQSTSVPSAVPSSLHQPHQSGTSTPAGKEARTSPVEKAPSKRKRHSADVQDQGEFDCEFLQLITSAHSLTLGQFRYTKAAIEPPRALL